jgi:hypothetical protein
MSREKGSKYCIEGRYFNAQGWAIGIAASITHEIDWAAYIGATFGEPVSSMTESETVQYVIKYGCKLAEKDARHFFPELKEARYRH